MISKESIRQANDKTFPVIAGKILHGGKHEFMTDGIISLKACKKCRYCDTEDLGPKCIITLTPANAFKWRDWAVEKFGIEKFKSTMRQVFAGNRKLNRGFSDWLCIAQPIHYIKAACLCAEKGE